ncbi:hypothetical protein V6N13_014493 [Hibiscus sabdariffa]|uniref:F-box domain-containing protein n=1 Tax=Hibiscus sabdariffa TaxID=183260 RepID=A0ABR2RVL8_9ROSI
MNAVLLNFVPLDLEKKKKTQLRYEEKDTRDRISELRDDVLVKILSFLPSEEAVLKTSFLSHRWKQLWESLPVCFDFDGLMPVRYGAYAKSFENSSDYRVRFDLDNDSWHYVDKWIKIAMKKKVKRLELNFIYFPRFLNMYYPFPKQCFRGIEFLCSLCLKHVGVSDDVMDWILSNCPVLESLNIEGTPLLRDPKVSASSLRLKHLHMSKCYYVRSVEISAPNLVSLEYHEELFTLHIRHAPTLTDLYYYSRLDSSEYGLPWLSNYLPQLVTLRLSTVLPFLERIKFPTCTNLRHLSCKVAIGPRRRLHILGSLIEASPFLHKFTLEITNYDKIKNKLSKVQTVVECSPHKHLKEMEIIGFLGQPTEVNFVAYLLKNAIQLEKIVIHNGFLDLLNRRMSYSKEFVEATRQIANESAHRLMEHRPKAELVLL